MRISSTYIETCIITHRYYAYVYIHSSYAECTHIDCMAEYVFMGQFHNNLFIWKIISTLKIMSKRYMLSLQIINSDKSLHNLR